MKWLALLLVLCTPLAAQTPPWNGIISSTRAVDWSATGLPATFPDGEITTNPWTPPTARTQCTQTVLNTDSEATIQTKYNACPAQTFLLLPPGTYSAWTSNFNMKSNVTLRGSGADPVTGTIIDCGGNTVGGISCPTWAGGGAPGCTWTGVATATLGQTQTTITGCTPHVNDLIVFEVTGPKFDIGTANFYLCSGIAGLCGQNGQTPTGIVEQLVRVTDFSAPPIVKFDPPLRFNYSDTNYTNPVSAIITSPVTGAGIENMRIKGDLTSGSAVAFMVNGYADWMTGVQMINATNGIALTSTFAMQTCHHCLIFENDIWQGLTTAGGAALTKKVVSDSLILNNNMHVGNEYCQVNGCVDNMSAYNYIHDSYYPTGNTIITNIETEHSFSMNNFYEGNEEAGVQIDMDHESHSEDTFFRNNFYGADPPFQNPQGVRAIEISGYSRFMNAVGNVLCANIPNFSAPCNTYISKPDGTATKNCTTGNSAFWIGCNGIAWPMDPLAVTTAMLWGNCDGVNAACRFVNSEVPSSYNEYQGFQLVLSGSGTSWSGTIPGGNLPCVNGNSLLTDEPSTDVLAFDYQLNGTLTNSAGVSSAVVNCTTGTVTVTTIPNPPTGTPILNYLHQTGTASNRQNSIPASHTLPPSFDSNLPQAAHANGGTGISWWKICTNYPTCTTFVTQPWPLAGPDVVNGPFTTVAGGGSGTAYDTPMKIWDINAPIDTTLQTSYAISSWGTFSGGIQPITIPVPSTGGHATTIILTGEFQISGATPSACNGTYHITGANGTPTTPPFTSYTIKFALASNPGCSGGNFLFPDVHRFSNTAFQPDVSNFCSGPPGGSLTPTSLTFGNQGVDTTSPAQQFVFCNGGPGAITISTITITGDFAQTNNCPFSPSMPANTSCTFAVTFTPTALGPRFGNVTITSNASNSPSVESLTGTGIPPILNGVIILNGVQIVNGVQITQ